MLKGFLVNFIFINDFELSIGCDLVPVLCFGTLEYSSDAFAGGTSSGVLISRDLTCCRVVLIRLAGAERVTAVDELHSWPQKDMMLAK